MSLFEKNALQNQKWRNEKGEGGIWKKELGFAKSIFVEHI